MIGLGRMGGPIAENIARGKFSLQVFNRSREKEQNALKAGASSATSIEQLAEESEIVLMCLSDPSAVLDVLTGSLDLGSHLRPGTFLVDLSTVDVETNRTCATVCAERGVEFLDAPVSGGVGGATSGTLTTMVGGEPSAFETVRPVLESFSQKVTHLGPLGAGTTVKLINQLLMGISLAAAAEAFALSERAGVDGQLLYEILSGSSAESKALHRAMPRFLTDDFSPAFSVDLLVKDLGLAANLGHLHRSPLFLTHSALQMYECALASGYGSEDTTSVVRPLLSLHEPERKT